MELFQRGLRNGGDTFNQQRRHLFGVLLEDERHFLPADRGFVLLPTIVVRGHRHGGIRDARFIGKRVSVETDMLMTSAPTSETYGIPPWWRSGGLRW